MTSVLILIGVIGAGIFKGYKLIAKNVSKHVYTMDLFLDDKSKYQKKVYKINYIQNDDISLEFVRSNKPIIKNYVI